MTGAAFDVVGRVGALSGHLAACVSLLAFVVVVFFLVLVWRAVFADSHDPTNRLVAILGALTSVLYALRPFVRPAPLPGAREDEQSRRPPRSSGDPPT